MKVTFETDDWEAVAFAFGKRVIVQTIAGDTIRGRLDGGSGCCVSLKDVGEHEDYRDLFWSDVESMEVEP